MYVFFTIQINLYPFILLSVRFSHTVKDWARLHRSSMTNGRALSKSPELAGLTMAGPVILKMK